MSPLPGRSAQGSEDGRGNHLQRTASCFWGILPELHQTALSPDKKQTRPLSGGQPGLGDPCSRAVVSPGLSQGLPGAHALTILFRFLHSLQYFCRSLCTCTGKQPPLARSAPQLLPGASRPPPLLPAPPPHLLFLFWSHVVGGCFYILQSLSVAITFLLQVLDLFLHLRCGQGTG